MKSTTHLPPTLQTILKLCLHLYMCEYSQHIAAWRRFVWCRGTALKSVNLCNVSAAQLIFKVQVAHWCKSLSGFVNSLHLETLYVVATELWRNITARCFELQSLDKLLLLWGLEYMVLRVINRNLKIEKYGYTIKRLLTKYREIFPPLVVVRTRPLASSGRCRTTTSGGNISRYLVNNL